MSDGKVSYRNVQGADVQPSSVPDKGADPSSSNPPMI